MDFHFYLPEKYLPDAAQQEAWKTGTITILEQSGKIATAQSWIYQTWAVLERAGFETNLTTEIPQSGVLITLAGCVPEDFAPPPEVFFVGIVADTVPHPAAHLHVVQNFMHAQRLRHSVYMPNWPQPNLLPREPERGQRFERVCFYGDPANLAPEIRDPAWGQSLKEELGLDFVIREAKDWSDYRETDCSVAIRDFGISSFLHKPATKLYNAWLAGVPFIGGADSAYEGDGKAGENYLIALQLNRLTLALRRLKEAPLMREQLVTAGRIAARAFSPLAMVGRWKHLLREIVPRRVADWQKRGRVSREIFRITQRANVWMDTKLRS